MLKILFFGMVAVFISIIPWLIGIRKCKKAREECKGSITGLIISFILSFIYMFVFFYCSCKAQTLLTTIMHMWPTLIIGLVVLIFIDDKYQYDHHVNVFRPETFCVMLGISISILIASGIIAPVQTLIYVHDTEDGDTSYMISASKVLDEAYVNTGSGYYIGAPTKRDIGGVILDMKEGTVEKYPAHESDKIPQWVDFKTTVPK